MAFIELAGVVPDGRTPVSGERLTGTPAIVRFELLCDGKPAYFLGSEERAEAVEPNWREALAFGRDLMRRSADIGVLVRLSAATLRHGTLSDFADCISVLADLLDGYWDSVYPELEEDADGGAPDASVRLGVLGRLDDDKLITNQLKEVALSRDAAGTVLVSLASLRASSEGVSPELLEEAVRDMDQIIECAGRIEQTVRLRSPIDADFSVHRFLEACAPVRRQLTTRTNSQPQVATETQAVAVDSGAPFSTGDVSVRGREHALKLLQQVIRYFEVAEPSSPVIGVLHRASSLVGKDFWAVIAELGDQRLVDAVGESRLFGKRT